MCARLMPRARSILWSGVDWKSLQTLRARCRWVLHERTVVDALTNRHGHSVTMLQLLRDGVLSIVDEDQELANRNTYR